VLTSGHADLAIGVAVNTSNVSELQTREIGEMDFVFAVAPHHPLARLDEPLSDELLLRHRMVAVADSGVRSNTSFGLVNGQDVLTVDSMQAKLEAQIRGIGAGFLPRGMVQAYLDAGLLVTRQVQRASRNLRLHYAWPGPPHARARPSVVADATGKPATRKALMETITVNKLLRVAAITREV
jgi:DNA-binding transcriptional LysR family regulator